MTDGNEDVSFPAVAKDVVVIAVMGMTGSGKSTFIQKLTGSKDAVVGDSLASCTAKPKLHEFTHHGSKIIMIDTPGFDDTYRTDADVLQDVATCLNMTYEANMKLTGLVYLHRIIDPRMTHGGMRNLAMFRKLCGSDPMKNVILATTFWGEVNTKLAQSRENELKTNPDYWAEMIDEGARMAQFTNTKDSALQIILELLPKGKISLDIQKQMCDQGLPLAKTHAGVALNAELEEIARKHEEEMQKLKKEMDDALLAHDNRLHATLQRQSTKYEKKLSQVHAQQEVLKETRRNELRAMEQEFDKRLRRMEYEKQQESTQRLKEALISARKADRLESQTRQSELLKARKEKERKKKNITKYVKIGAGVVTATVSVAGCFINPGLAGHAISGFVGLVNTFFDDGDGDVDGGTEMEMNPDSGIETETGMETGMVVCDDDDQVE